MATKIRGIIHTATDKATKNMARIHNVPMNIKKIKLFINISKIYLYK